MSPFTRSRAGNSNDGAHVEQKNWAIVRTVVGHHRYDTGPEPLLLNKMWALQPLKTNYFCPQQKLISKVRTGAKVTKRYDRATTPHQRATTHSTEDPAIMADTYADRNHADIQRQIQALIAMLLKITTSKAAARQKTSHHGHHHPRVGHRVNDSGYARILT